MTITNKTSLLLKKRYDLQIGMFRLKEEYLNSVYVDKIIDLLQENECVLKCFGNAAGGDVSFYTKEDRKNGTFSTFISVNATQKQRLSAIGCPDWKRVFIKLEEFFKI